MQSFIENIKVMGIEKPLNRDVTGVVSRVVGKWQANLDLFEKRDLSDWPTPRIEWRTVCVLATGKRLKIRLAHLLLENDFEILISDADLAPGESTYNGRYGYRVNMFGGETANRYRHSTGFAMAGSENIYVDRSQELVVSDNWAETITTADEICDLLDGGFLLHPMSN